MSSSSTSFSSYSVKLVRNIIPSLHLFSTPQQPATAPPNRWSADLIEAVCKEACDLMANAELEAKQKVKCQNDNFQRCNQR